MRPVFSDGVVHVKARQCKTCIFRPGNLMDLQPGRVEEMVERATANNSCIPCHSTIHGQATQEAVCRGFFDQHKTSILQIAERLGFVREVA